MSSLTKKGLRIEIWNMLPDECRIIMKPIRKSYLDSIMASIENYATWEKIQLSSAIKLIYVTKKPKEFQMMADKLHECLSEKLNKSNNP